MCHTQGDKFHINCLHVRFDLEPQGSTGLGVERPSQLALPRERERVSILLVAGWAPWTVWMSAENLIPTGIRSPDHPARNESLHQLSYPRHTFLYLPSNIIISNILRNILIMYLPHHWIMVCISSVSVCVCVCVCVCIYIYTHTYTYTHTHTHTHTNVIYAYFFIYPFIVPPVLLQTLSTLRSLINGL